MSGERLKTIAGAGVLLWVICSTGCIGGVGAPLSDTGRWDSLEGVDWDDNTRMGHGVLVKNGFVVTCGQGDADAFFPVDSMIEHVTAIQNIFCGGHVNLGDGRIFWMGGTRDDSVPSESYYEGLSKAFLFDPDTKIWTEAAKMTAQRWYPTATMLHDGKVAVIGGWIARNRPGKGNIPNSLFEIYDPEDGPTGTWTILTEANNPQNASYPFMFLLPDRSDPRLFFAGCQDCSKSTYTLSLTNDPVNNIEMVKWKQFGTHDVRGGSAVMYRPGLIMKAGGLGGNGQATTRTAVIDTTFVLDNWIEDDEMTFPRYDFNLVVLPTGNVLAIGGRKLQSGPEESHTEGQDIGPEDAVMQAELWKKTLQSEKGAWVPLAAMSIPRTYHSWSVLLPDARVFVGGAEMAPEIFSPPYLFVGNDDALRPSFIVPPPPQINYDQEFAVDIQSQGPTPATLVMIRLGASTHGFDQEQRFIVLDMEVNEQCPINNDTCAYIVRAPQHGYFAPPGYYMLFAIDAAGVPSLAEMVQLDGEATAPPCPTNWTVLASGNADGLGHAGDGAGVAIADLGGDGLEVLALAYDAPDGENKFKYRMGLIDELGILSLSLNTSFEAPGLGHSGDGAGVAITNLDEDAAPDAIFLAYDAPEGQNEFKYAVGRNLVDGIPADGWELFPVPPMGISVGVGHVGDGVGIDVTDLNRNGRPDMIVVAYDDPDGQNEFKYRIAWDLSITGAVSSWSSVHFVDGMGHHADGAGAAIANLNGNDHPDLVLMVYDDPNDDPDSQNGIKIKIGCDLDQLGATDDWSEVMQFDGLGNRGNGAGLSAADIDGDGKPELVIMVYDGAVGQNSFKWRVLHQQ